MENTDYIQVMKETIRAVPGVVKFLHEETLKLIFARPYSSAMKSADLGKINLLYHDIITAALLDYFEGGGIAASRNEMKQACIQAFSDAFDLGWSEGGAELPIEEEALNWIEARINEEFIYIEDVFGEASILRRDKEFDFFTWINARADGYTRTLKEIYSEARLMVQDNVMVTFDGDDGKESCADCKRLKGKRHKLSWFKERDSVPPFGEGLECHPGRNCEHYLITDKGEIITA